MTAASHTLASMAGTTLILMRHPQTVWNAESRLMSRTDLGLSAKGIGQAQDRVSLIRSFDVDSIVSSPLLRCVQAARVIADELGLAVAVMDELREADFGDFEGMTPAELSQGTKSDAYAAWRDPRSESLGPPNGESWDQLGQRADRALETLAAQHAGCRVLVVSHGYFIRALIVRSLFAAPAAQLRRFDVDNASLSVLSNGDGYWKLQRHNY